MHRDSNSLQNRIVELVRLYSFVAFELLSLFSVGQAIRLLPFCSGLSSSLSLMNSTATASLKSLACLISLVAVVFHVVALPVEVRLHVGRYNDSHHVNPRNGRESDICHACKSCKFLIFCCGISRVDIYLLLLVKNLIYYY